MHACDRTASEIKDKINKVLILTRAGRPRSHSPNFAKAQQMPAATRRSRRQSHVVAPATAASSSAPTEPDEPLRQATAESAALLLEDGGLVVLRRVKAAAVFAVPQLTTPAASGRQRWLCLALHNRGGEQTHQTAHSQRATARTPNQAAPKSPTLRFQRAGEHSRWALRVRAHHHVLRLPGVGHLRAGEPQDAMARPRPRPLA